MKPHRLWTGNFVLAIFVNLFLCMVFYLLVTSMAGYALTRFHTGQALAGLASSAFITGSVLGRIFAGKYIDLVGRKRALLITLVASIGVALVHQAVGGIWLLIALRFLHGAVYGFSHSVLMVAAQSLIPAARRAEGTGYFGVAGSLASAAGPAVAVALVHSVGYDWLFTAAAASSLIAGVFVIFLKVPERTPSREEVADKWRLSLRSVIEPGAVAISGVMFIGGIAFASVLAFLDTHTTELGLPGLAGWFFVVYAATTLAARLVLGRVQDRRGDDLVVYPMLVLAMGGLLLLAVGQGPAAVLVAGGFLGVGFGTLMPAIQTIVVNRSTPARMGVAVSTYFLVMDLGTGFGPLLLGSLAQAGGTRSIFAGGIVVTLLALVLYALVTRRPKPKPA
ncbi:MFS transporter [Brevibacterium sp. 50QC2O2]|uniref:MFS transporter n=1 Tax=Brevibacterium sp. 50QC2O2 TaxID=2968459 RepID=UPI00211CF36B|nr:MFS transporter [Brevibacterium sp. 50QC2O2]